MERGTRVGEVGNPAAKRSSNVVDEESGVFTWSVWQSRGVWMEYDPVVCEVIEAAFCKGQNTVCSSQDHVIYFADMLQYDVGPTGPDPRPVCRHSSFGRAEILQSLRRRNQVLRNSAKDVSAQGMKAFTCEAGAYEEAGIGCSLANDPHNGPVYIGALHCGGPAALSGKIACGDMLVTINGEDVADMKDSDRLSGPPGTVVNVGIRRHGCVEIVQLLRQGLPREEESQIEPVDNVGVGMRTNVIGSHCFITDLAPGGAARLSGEISEGDMLSSIDGQTWQEGGEDRWLDRLRGREFTRVLLTVVSCRTQLPKDIYLVRRREYAGPLLRRKTAYDAALCEATSTDLKGVWGARVNSDGNSAGGHAGKEDEFDKSWNIAQEASEAINKVGARLGSVAHNAVASVGESVGEKRWNVLQFGSHVTGIVRGVTSAVSNVVQTAVSDVNSSPSAATPIRGGTLSEVFIRSGEDVEGLSINGAAYGSTEGGIVSDIKRNVTVKEIHTWKKQHLIRFIRIVFSDLTEISGGTRGDGVYQGLLVNGEGFRIRSSSFRILDVQLGSGQHGSVSSKSSQAMRPSYNEKPGAGKDSRSPKHQAHGLSEFSSISDPGLIVSLKREGEPVEGDPTVFRWRGSLMLQPYWSKGFLIVRGVPSGDIVYRGKLPNQQDAADGESEVTMDGSDLKVKIDGSDLARDAQLLCEILSGRLSISEATNVLKRNDFNVALSLNELLQSEGENVSKSK